VRGFLAGATGGLGGQLEAKSLRRGELVLVSADERWIDLGDHNLEALRRRLNALLGGEVITKITVRPGRRQPKRPISSRQEPEPAPAERPTSVVIDAADEIADTRLREAFLNFAVKVTATRRERRSKD